MSDQAAVNGHVSSNDIRTSGQGLYPWYLTKGMIDPKLRCQHSLALLVTCIY